MRLAEERRRAVLQILQCGELVTGPFLQSLFAVNQRTIIRDMQWLRKQGYPVDGERGYGYLMRKTPKRCCPTCGRLQTLQA